MVRALEVFMQLFGACILGFFAYVPLYICYHMLQTSIAEPEKFDMFFVVAFGISGALSYFLCLLTFRAATGRGRKSDGALLPPAVMAVFIGLFALVGVAAFAIGVWQGNLAAILGGIGYVSIVGAAWRASRRSKSNEI